MPGRCCCPAKYSVFPQSQYTNQRSDSPNSYKPELLRSPASRTSSAGGTLFPKVSSFHPHSPVLSCRDHCDPVPTARCFGRPHWNQKPKPWKTDLQPQKRLRTRRSPRHPRRLPQTAVPCTAASSRQTDQSPKREQPRPRLPGETVSLTPSILHFEQTASHFSSLLLFMTIVAVICLPIPCFGQLPQGSPAHAASEHTNTLAIALPQLFCPSRSPPS